VLVCRDKLQHAKKGRAECQNNITTKKSYKSEHKGGTTYDVLPTARCHSLLHADDPLATVFVGFIFPHWADSFPKQKVLNAARKVIRTRQVVVVRKESLHLSASTERERERELERRSNYNTRTLLVTTWTKIEEMKEAKRTVLKLPTS